MIDYMNKLIDKFIKFAEIYLIVSGTALIISFIYQLITKGG